MCARRFLIFVFVLILLFVAGAFAIFQFGQQVLIKQATPQGPFRKPRRRRAARIMRRPKTGWRAPTFRDDPSSYCPQGSRFASGPAAIFYVHPTTYLEARSLERAALGRPRTATIAVNLFVQSQASAFNSAGKVWAPRYRQAAFGAFLLKSQDAQKALDLAYRTCRAAFDEFLKRNPGGPRSSSPAHSQGALHLSRLLRERAATTQGPRWSRPMSSAGRSARPPTCQRWGLPPAPPRADRLRPVLAELRPARQPRPDHRRLGGDARPDRSEA